MVFAGAKVADACSNRLNGVLDVECSYMQSDVTELPFFATKARQRKNGWKISRVVSIRVREKTLRKLMPEPRQSINNGVQCQQRRVEANYKFNRQSANFPIPILTSDDMEKNFLCAYNSLIRVFVKPFTISSLTFKRSVEFSRQQRCSRHEFECIQQWRHTNDKSYTGRKSIILP
ncbi:hypothetical protein RND81_12G216600 [Saponaria officinalis]|uniref:Uncharacterized protein n=1 Tax=Saponaria officinalis TaxID=3572 RepID=A0AAW1HDT5_SAPOF